MVFNFSNIDLHDRPILTLKNAGGSPIGILGYAYDVTVDLKYNEISALEFKIPKFVDGTKVPFYDELVGRRIIELQDIGQFILLNPTENGDGIKTIKECKASSLEYEFTDKKISIPEGTYRLYADGSDFQNSIIGMISEIMPGWSFDDIPDTLSNKYRTFDVSNENVYNFIKGTLQKSYGCIFDFDTMNRIVIVRDIEAQPDIEPVYLSNDNLIKEIEVQESTEDIVTRLDVNGADGVDIRMVNPTGTNKIIMLDYFMTSDNFSSALITKYNNWKQTCDSYSSEYYTLSVRASIATEQKITENANLSDLKNDLTGLEGQQAVIIQAISQGIEEQSALDEINASIAAKKASIAAKEAEISGIQQEIDQINSDMADIVNTCRYENAFTESERTQMDRYIRDGEVSEDSFVISDYNAYSNTPVGSNVDANSDIDIDNAAITKTTYATGKILYDIVGGTVDFQEPLGISGNIIHAVIERIYVTSPWKKQFIATFHLSNGSIGDSSFDEGCLSISGSYSSVTDSGIGDGSLSASISGYVFFTENTSEYKKRSVSWDLYEYGESVIQKIAYPSYTFSVTSANFLALEEFEYFKNNLSLGQCIYLMRDESTELHPILVGARFSYEDLTMLELEFGDSYTASDSSFRLVDLLEKSVSMGKDLSLGKYIYSSFVDSGASTNIKTYMESALDVAKNAIISSENQAISWDEAGIRLRKWANQAHTAYDPEQIWMSNNSIMMTDDSWATAKMAVGKFHDENMGDCWGIVAPMIAGTVLAGSRLIIESAKKEGGKAVFKVDENGCKLYNSDFEISKTVGNKTTQILLDPEHGIIIGEYPVYNEQTHAVDENKAKFWADDNGNIHVKGDINATTLHIGNQTAAEYVDERAEDIADGVKTSLTTDMEKIELKFDNRTNINPNLLYSDNFDNDDLVFDLGDKTIPSGSRYVDACNLSANKTYTVVFDGIEIPSGETNYCRVYVRDTNLHPNFVAGDEPTYHVRPNAFQETRIQVKTETAAGTKRLRLFKGETTGQADKIDTVTYKNVRVYSGTKFTTDRFILSNRAGATGNVLELAKGSIRPKKQYVLSFGKLVNYGVEASQHPEYALNVRIYDITAAANVQVYDAVADKYFSTKNLVFSDALTEMPFIIEDADNTLANHEFEIRVYANSNSSNLPYLATLMEHVKLEEGTHATIWQPSVMESTVKMASLQVGLNGIEGRVESVSGDVTAIRADVDGIEADVSDISGDVSRVQQQANKIEMSVTGGANNYLNNTDLYTTITSAGYGGDYVFSHWNELRGKTVTISVDVELDNVTAASSGSHRVGIEPKFTTSAGTLYASTFHTISTTGPDDFKGRVAKKFTLPDGDLITFNQKDYYIQGVASGTAKVGRAKLELGEIATPWSPCPDDPAGSLKTSSITIKDDSIDIASTGNISIASGASLNIRAQDIHLTTSQTLDNKLSTMTSATTTAQSTANTANTKAGNAQIDASNAQNDATNALNLIGNENSGLTKAVADLKIAEDSIKMSVTGGANNYLNDTDFYTTITSAGYGGDYVFSHWNELRGKTVTISVDVELDNVTAASSGSHRVGIEPKFTTSAGTLYASTFHAIPTTGTDNFKGRITRKFTLPDGDLITFNQKDYYIQGAASGTAKVGRAKLELGEIATPWTPCPDDPAGSLKTSSVTIQDTGIDISTSGTLNMQGSKVNIRSLSKKGNTIVFGSNGSDPTFSVDEEGSVYAKSGSFGSISVDNIEINGSASGENPIMLLGTNVIFATTKPSGIRPCIWLKPTGGGGDITQIGSYSFTNTSGQERAWSKTDWEHYYPSGTDWAQTVTATGSITSATGSYSYELTINYTNTSYAANGIAVTATIGSAVISGTVNIPVGTGSVKIIGTSTTKISGSSVSTKIAFAKSSSLRDGTKIVLRGIGIIVKAQQGSSDDNTCEVHYLA